MISDLPVALAPRQLAQLDAYVGQLERVNARVNLVARPASRVDLERHVRHCLALATRPLPDGATVVDWGTGGGLPAIPLAIAFPKIRMVAVDTVGKKTEAVRLFARRLELDNVQVWNGRAEAYDGPAPHLSVSRATAPLASLWAWHARARQPAEAVEDAWPPGLVCLKGGDLTVETAALVAAVPEAAVQTTNLGPILGDDWADKAIVLVTD